MRVASACRARRAQAGCERRKAPCSAGTARRLIQHEDGGLHKPSGEELAAEKMLSGQAMSTPTRVYRLQGRCFLSYRPNSQLNIFVAILSSSPAAAQRSR